MLFFLKIHNEYSLFHKKDLHNKYPHWINLLFVIFYVIFMSYTLLWIIFRNI